MGMNGNRSLDAISGTTKVGHFYKSYFRLNYVKTIYDNVR